MFGGVFSWSNVLYERVYPGGDLLIQFVGRDAYRTRPIPWSLYLALLFYFDYIPSTHYMIRQLELFPNELDECWLAGRVFIEEEK